MKRRNDPKNRMTNGRRRRRVPVENMTREEIIRAKRAARRRQVMRNRRRFYRILFVLFIIFIVVFLLFFSKGKSAESVSGNNAGGVRSGAGVNFGDSYFSESMVSNNEDDEEIATPEKVSMTATVSAGDLSGVIEPTKALDVTRGKVALPTGAVSANAVSIRDIKTAMSVQSYFTGTSRNVDSYLQAYGEGSWHGIKDVTGDIIVFYDGSHVEKESSVDEDGNVVTKIVGEEAFKVEFLVYEDGSFMVTAFYKKGVAVDDYEAALREIVKE